MHRFHWNIPRSFAGYALSILLLLTLSCSQDPGMQNEVAVTTSSDEARADFFEGRGLFENLRLDEARQHFSSALERDPAFALAYYYRATTAASQEEFQEYQQKAVLLAADVSAGERLMIEALQANVDNNPVVAVTLGEELVRLFPNDKRAYLQLGFYYGGLEEHAKAIAAFERALKLDENFAPAYNALGYAYEAVSEFGEAEEAFRNYIRLLPEEANPYDSMGDLYTRMGKFDEAIEQYKMAANLNPVFAFSQRKIGTCLLFKGQYEMAREAYSSALQMEPTQTGAVTDMQMIAGSYLYEGKFAEALQYADRAYMMAAKAGNLNQQASIHATKCRIFLESGQFEQAGMSMQECMNLVIDSTMPYAVRDQFTRNALFDKAQMAARQRDFSKAMKTAEEYRAEVQASVNPRDLEDYHLLLGLINYEQGNDSTAILHLEKADTDNPYAVYHMALSVARSGNHKRAAGLYDKVANWNQNSLLYSFVRNKAMLASAN